MCSEVFVNITITLDKDAIPSINICRLSICRISGPSESLVTLIEYNMYIATCVFKIKNTINVN